jgi:hypothetical protein
MLTSRAAERKDGPIELHPVQNALAKKEPATYYYQQLDAHRASIHSHFSGHLLYMQQDMARARHGVDVKTTILAGGILLAIGLQALCFFVSFVTNARLVTAAAILYLPGTTFALYFLYEAVMPSYMNIRVDLLFLYPLLALSFGMAIARIKKHRRLKNNRSRSIFSGA